MNDRLHGRLAALLGLLLATVVGAWWLAGTRLAQEQAMGCAGITGSALTSLWLARAMVLGPFALRTGALRRWQSGALASLALVAAAWPVVVAATFASARPAFAIVLGEVVLLLAGIALAAVGHGLRMLLRQADAAALAGTVLGGALAAGVWSGSTIWSAWLP
jgi:hypothetical protein